jgi:hypothetical protein
LGGVIVPSISKAKIGTFTSMNCDWLVKSNFTRLNKTSEEVSHRAYVFRGFYSATIRKTSYQNNFVGTIIYVYLDGIAFKKTLVHRVHDPDFHNVLNLAAAN